MKNKYIYLFALFISILLITGFKNEDRYFPAPLDETVAAFYLNFAKTGIYKDSDGNNKSRLLKEINYICASLGQPENLAEKFLNETFLSGIIKLKEIYAYYADPMSFSIVLTGKIDVDGACGFIGEEKVNRAGENASTILNLELPGNQRLFIEMTPKTLVMCPENIAGNIMDNVLYEKNKIKYRLPEFYKSVLNSSYTALEAKISEKEAKMILPEWLKKLKQISFHVAKAETNMQMLFSSSKEMNKASEPIKESLSSFESSLNENERFALNAESSSIYISANNSDAKLAKTILNRTAAFLIQFFITAPAASAL